MTNREAQPITPREEPQNTTVRKVFLVLEEPRLAIPPRYFLIKSATSTQVRIRL
jgi:hypothetical protein